MAMRNLPADIYALATGMRVWAYYIRQNPESWVWHLETVEMENRGWNDQNENCLLSNTYLSKMTTCKTRPLELQGVIQCMHASISQRL